MPLQNPQSSKHAPPAQHTAVSAAQTINPAQEASQPQQNNNDNSQAGRVSSPSSANHESTTEGRKITRDDVQLVQNLVERCLQLYMNQTEVINTLMNQAKIEPGFTRLIWKKLEEENSEFFKAYYTRLKLKRHIMTFNHLLEQQVHLMQKMRIIPTKAPMQQPLIHNDMHQSSMGQVGMGYPVPQMSGIQAPSMPALPHSPVVSSENPLAENFHDSPGISNSMDPSLIMHSGGGDHSGGGNAANFPFGSITDMGLDTSFVSHAHEHNASFDGGDEDGHDHDPRDSLGALGHLPRNFSLSDLAAELGASDLEALGAYSSPFMSPETESFLQSPDDKHEILTNCVFSEGDKLLDDLDFGDLK